MDSTSENKVSVNTQNNEDKLKNVPFPKKKNVKKQVENVEVPVEKKKKYIANGEEKDVERMEVVDISDEPTNKPTKADQQESLYAPDLGGSSTLQNNSN
jgi:hypothetical protein